MTIQQTKRLVRISMCTFGILGMASCLPEVTVMPPEVGTVTLIGLPDSLYVGNSATLASNVRDTRGTDLPDEPRSWRSSNAAVATVTAEGRVTAVGPGLSNITVQAGAQTSSAAARVVAPVASIVISPATPSLRPGGSVPLTASLRDVANNVLTGRIVTWQSANTAIATVSGAGVVTALAYAGGLTRSVLINVTSESVTNALQVTVEPTAVRTVAVAPLSGTLTEGNSATITFTAAVRDSSNNLLSNDGRTIVWSSSDTLVARVTVGGVASAVRQGTAQIRATTGGVTGSSSIFVQGRPVATVVVAPDTFTLQDLGTRQLSVTLLADNGEVLTGRTVTWQSLDSTRATVSSAGLVTATTTAGTARIVATSGGRADTAVATVTVRAVATVVASAPSDSVFVGDSIRFSAAALSATGDTLQGRTITWASSSAAFASISAAGWARGVAPGAAQIRATVGGVQSPLLPLRVLGRVNTVTITPSNPQVVKGDSTQLAAVLRDASNNVLTGRVVTWVSSDTTVVRVNAAGRAFGLRSGSATITASSEGRSGTTLATVPQDVASVTVAPATATVQLGYTSTYTATVRDSLNNVLTGRTVRWSSANPAIARIDSVTGIATATATAGGSTTITATSEGRTGTATITVPVPQPVSTVVASPAADTLLRGDTVTVSTTLRDAATVILLGRTISFTSLNPAVATVTQQNLASGIAGGRVTAVSAGATSIVVASEGVADTVPIVVLDSVATIEILPSTAVSIEKPATQQLTITLRNSSGAVLSAAGRSITWMTSNAAVATVNSAGLVTAVGGGLASNNTTVQVSVNGVTQAKAINVLQPVKSVVVSAAHTFVNYAPHALSVTLRDTAGVIVTGRSVTWSSSAPTVATVSASGVVTPVATSGTATITATSEGRGGTTTVTIPAVASVQVSPSPASVAVGETLQLTASALSAVGDTLTGRSVIWGSTNTQVVTVDASTGLVSGVAQGTATIRANIAGVLRDVGVTVTPSCRVSDLFVNGSPGGTLTANDCPAGTGFVERRYRFVTTSPVVVRHDFTRSGPLALLTNYDSDTSLASPFTSAACALGATLCTSYALYAPGAYIVRVRNQSTLGVGQTFGVNPTLSSLPLACLTIPLGLSTSQSASFSLSLTTSSCFGAGDYLGSFATSLKPGQTITLNMQSSVFDAELFLTHPSLGILAFDDNGGGGTNARLTYTNTFTVDLGVTISARAKAGLTGAYVLSGQLSP